ncbi:hypothetical protein Mal48_36850 [Thalassoglobus polymorphus]|uniref:Uncharacterized protein n=1 Tax=Thalassoglobus polymorphus TaxID=2527994 RepID=A0A517QS38_9PLAN|nr:hypothetical protein Mal48_36850 [Thalassoglobus polymorphus]
MSTTGIECQSDEFKQKNVSQLTRLAGCETLGLRLSFDSLTSGPLELKLKSPFRSRSHSTRCERLTCSFQLPQLSQIDLWLDVRASWGTVNDVIGLVSTGTTRFGNFKFQGSQASLHSRFYEFSALPEPQSDESALWSHRIAFRPAQASLVRTLFRVRNDAG